MCSFCATSGRVGDCGVTACRAMAGSPSGGTEEWAKGSERVHRVRVASRQNLISQDFVWSAGGVHEQAHRARLVSMLAKVFPRLDADAISHVVDLWAHVGYY